MLVYQRIPIPNLTQNLNCRSASPVPISAMLPSWRAIPRVASSATVFFSVFGFFGDREISSMEIMHGYNGNIDVICGNDPQMGK